ncbi:hypothetical protein DM02DRAFT_113196 [Periconia macrospinosa]|uniref:Uncharacterized protein n=1 Tax=Periconia macrospinosa TaxID=97972 RepID=A0A2V1E585_9PLEO|nr:hypothetical protein DM02DRAFT_113196 [Periconia macrospinosa]
MSHLSLSLFLSFFPSFLSLPFLPIPIANYTLLVPKYCMAPPPLDVHTTDAQQQPCLSSLR